MAIRRISRNVARIQQSLSSRAVTIIVKSKGQMNRSSSQLGFSLIELLVAMAITVVAIAAAVLLIAKFARTAGAYGEVSPLEEQRGSADTLLRSDFEGAGYNLARPS